MIKIENVFKLIKRNEEIISQRNENFIINSENLQKKFKKTKKLK